ncbi:MAG TPA: hypothetical protein VNL71_06080 [Chloroflexota bacterium]|nr:hypothetical protein [Chloroflexota bacterium]
MKQFPSPADRRGADCLFGTAEALRQAIDVPMIPSYRHLYDQALNAMRQSLSEADFAGAWAEGRHMLLTQAMECVLGED